MSRVNITFRTYNSGRTYDVLSPDGALDGQAFEKLGEVLLAPDGSKRYQYMPVKGKENSFVNPEVWFLDPAERKVKIDSVLPDSRDLGRSFRIHREAMRLLGIDVVFPVD